MSLDPLSVLEERIRQMLEAMNQLKQDNAVLEDKVRRFGQRLAKHQRESVRWTQDRGRLRIKVQKLLQELESLSVTKPRKRGEA